MDPRKSLVKLARDGISSTYEPRFATRIAPHEAVPVIVRGALEVVVCVEDTPKDRRGDEA